MPTPRAALIAACALTALLQLLTLPAVAQVNVIPPLADITLAPGVDQRVEFQVSNPTSDPADCTVKVGSLGIPGGAPIAGPEDTARSCAAWVQVTPDSFTVPPAATAKITARIRVPRDAAGGYSMTIQLDAAATGAPGAVTGAVGAVIRFSHRRMIPVIVSVKGPRANYPSLQVAGIDLQGPEAAAETGAAAGRGRAASIGVSIRNTGLANVRIAGDVVFRNGRGQRLASTPLVTGFGYMLAGWERTFTTSVPWPLPDGVYSVGVDLRPANSRATVMTASETYSVLAGRITKGEPTEEMRRVIDATRPKFTLDPMDIGLAAAPGGRASAQTRITSLTEEGLTLEPHYMSWSLDDTGKVVLGPPDAPRGLGGQVSVRPAKLAVVPGKTLNSAVTCGLPKGADGEYYPAVVFSPAGEPLPEDPYVLQQRAFLLAVSAKGTAAPAVVIRDLTHEALGDLGQRFGAMVVNDGNAQCAVEAEMAVSQGMQTIERFALSQDPVQLLAAGRRTLSAEWSRLLAPGRYKATVTARWRVDDSDKTAEASIEFEVVRAEAPSTEIAPTSAPPAN